MDKQKMNESRDEILTVDREYIQYALELEHVLSQLEEHLHDSNDPDEIVTHALKTACEFYGGDGAGFIEVDLDLSIWSPYLWCTINPDDHFLDSVGELESTEFLHRWVAAMKENRPICVENCNAVSNEYPHEYELYQKLGMRSVIAVSVKPFPTGFVVVRNPKRYVSRSSMLQLLAFVVIKGVSEKKLVDRVKMAWSPENIRDDHDVIINLFGELEIITNQGVIRDRDMKSPKISRVLTYLVLHKRSTSSASEIAEAIWPEEAYEQENAGKNMKYLIYRLRQYFSLISQYQLIESTPSGYRLNPDLRIRTDLEMFDDYRSALESTASVIQKVEFMKKALSLYRGRLLAVAGYEPWLAPVSVHYSLEYLALSNELMKTLAELRDYSGVHYYAARVLCMEPGNVNAHFWLVYAAHRQGSTELALATLREAKRILTDEEYDELIIQLKSIKDKPFEIKVPRGIK